MTAPTPTVHPLTVELGKLGDTTARMVLDVLDEIERGSIPRAALGDLATVLVRLGAEQAAHMVLAELVETTALAAGVAPGPVPRISGAALADGRVQQAVATITAGAPEEVRTRLERLARSTVVRAAQDTRHDAIRRDKRVEAYTRGLDSDACQLCRWWWREGRAWPKEHHMPRHPGCSCVAVPVVSTRSATAVSRDAARDSDARRELDERGEYLGAFGTDRRHASQ